MSEAHTLNGRTTYSSEHSERIDRDQESQRRDTYVEHIYGEFGILSGIFLNDLILIVLYTIYVVMSDGLKCSWD